jgi:hypothetical protein
MLKDNPITMLIWGHQVDLIDPNLSIVDFCVFVVPQKSKTAAIADSVCRNQ